MKIWEAISMGVVCGLQTIDECVCNVELHYTSLIPMDRVNEEFAELYEESEKFKAAFGNEIPMYFHHVEDKLLDYYFKYEDGKASDESIEWPDDFPM